MKRLLFYSGVAMRKLVAVLAMLGTVSPALTAQTPPVELLQRPENADRIRGAIATSGLTPLQIRARLRALGYSESILDQFLENRVDSLAKPSPGALDAIRALGLSANADNVAADVVPGRLGDRRSDLPPERTGPLKIFGREIFDRVTSQFQPALSGPVDETYRLGAGDVLVLILTGDVELTHQLEVTREGFVLIPQVGQVYVSGLTLGQLDRVLATRLGRVYSGISGGANGPTKFQVTVAKLRTNQIFVIGEVIRPGSYQVSSAGTALSALYLAGGPSNNGSFRQIVVRRGQRVVDSLDLYDYLLRGDTRHDVRLETGDVIFVPVRSVPVEIGGAIVRPAIYELQAGETLRDLIRAAGGFEPTALQRRIQIDRVLPPEQRVAGGRDRVVLDITEDQLQVDAPAFPLAAADRVSVFSVSDRRRNVVTVRGNVWVAGQVGFKTGMRLSDALRLAGGPKPDVYLSQVLISRLGSDSTRSQLRSSFRDSTGVVDNDLVLAEDDDIQVFSRTEFRPNRYVAITGAVRRPGRVPFYEGMTLRDAILGTGGLTEDALLSDAELARLPTDRSQGALAMTSRIALDSTYLFDRSPSGAYGGPPGLPAPASGAPEVKLDPYDNVLILRQPDWELARAVQVTGQVRYPGRYVLRSKTERLADLIVRAGGLTKEAYPDGAELYRQVTPVQTAPIKIGSRLIAADSARVTLPVDDVLAQGVGLDLARAMAKPEGRENLIIQAGDSVFVPEYQATVRVLGAVNAPTSVIYRPGWNLYDYVGAAGGVARLGDKGRSYVVQPGGRLESVKSRGLFSASKPRPMPGAVVFVPERDPNDKKDWAGLLSSIAQILASTVAIIVVATR